MNLIDKHQVDIRPATRSDAQGMVAVKHAAVFNIGAENYPPDQLAHWSGHLDQAHIKRLEERVSENSIKFYVVTIEKTVMGYGVLDLETGEIGGPYIRPDHGREGLATLILEQLMEDAHEASLPMVFSEAPANVVAFFTKHGFESKGPSSKTLADGETLDTFRMQKSIAH